MAQNRADEPSVIVEPDDLETYPKGHLSSPELTVDLDELEVVDRPSMDKLLAMTGEDLSVDEEAQALKEAVDRGPRGQETGRGPRAPALLMPTAHDLGGSQPPPPVAPASVPPPPLVPSDLAEAKPIPPPLPSKPPPLPGRAPSKAPSRRPPPLPKGAPPEISISARPSARPPAHPSEPVAAGPLVDLLQARLAVLEKGDDKVGLARAHIELSIVQEQLGDESRATVHAESALKIDPKLAAAHAILRRRNHHRQALPQMLEHLGHEIEAATAEAAAVELLVEKARILDAMGNAPEVTRAAWEQALTRAPNHAAALKGLESNLQALALGESADAYDALASHLGRMADAYAAQPQLAAWLHVERAQILEKKLGRLDAARGALERALALDPSVGPVRDLCVLHIAAHQDHATLAALLEEEAQLERDPARAARLELDAACIAHTRLKDDARAIVLLERAAARAPTTPSVDRRVLDELVRLYESATQYPEAIRARRARLQFLTDPAAKGHELRTLAVLCERIGDYEGSIHEIQSAMAIDPNDTTLIDSLDRMLAAASKHEQRLSLWIGESQRTDDGTKRARALGRAAVICENMLGRPDEALRHLRAAWVAAPGDPEVFDHLSRLMSPAPSERVDGEVRSLIELYGQAAQTARDPGRRVSYLERMAVLWEELIGDPHRAARTYEEILQHEPDRRGAILGLSRNAARMGDDRALARALLEEARLADDGSDVLALRIRAASVLAKVDPTRALSVVQDVLEQDSAHSAARALETRLHEEAGRWEAAAKSIHTRIENALQTQEKISLYLALAQIQDVRLRAPLDALESLKRARELDPSNPVPPEEIARVMEATGDPKALRSAYEDLAASASSREEKARWLVHAAEIDELKTGDDLSAARLYARALVETPDDDLIADRLARVLARPERTKDRAGLLARRIERAEGAVKLRLSFQLAWLLLELGQDLPEAIGLLEGILAEQPTHVPALRMLETISRKTSAWAPLSRVLSRQGEDFADVRARLGALWNLAALEEWKLPVGDTAATYARILDLDPTDPGALEATVRRELGNARRGDARSRKAVIGALRALCALASDESMKLAMQLRLAIVLETQLADMSEGSSPSVAREALERYRAGLMIDPLSVTAATGLARLANRLNDPPAAVAAATSLAELATQPKMRARYLLDAAELLLGALEGDDRLGSMEERRQRAGKLLEQALDSEPDAVAAAARLAQLRLEMGQGERLVDTFRAALQRAKSTDAIILLGTEIARVARDELRDYSTSIDAMRRVREAAPQHVPSLLMLSELCVAQRAWPEAVEALESVVSIAREPGPRLTALFALASVYEKVLHRPEEAERCLRLALEADPKNPRAIRALLHRLVAKQKDGSGGRAGKAEIADLTEALADTERDPLQKAEILLELAEQRAELSEHSAAERALIEAVAQAPSNARAFARLGRFFRTGQGQIDAVSYARALTAVIGRAKHLGNLDARWLAALGQLEIESLGRLRDGVHHLQQAVQLDSTLYESRFELANAFARMSANDEASRTLLAMITPSPQPLLALADPAAALELLERTLGGERRAEEALVVSELRAIDGDLDEGRHAWLRNRKLVPLEQHHSPLDRATLVTHVLPQEGRHVMLEVAAAMAGLESRMLRADLTELGISSRDRISPRSGNPTRGLLDRLARALGITDVDLVIAQTVARTRVLAQDTLWIVVPRSLTELPEPTQLASMARALARIALGVPWLEELPPPHIEAFLIACARQVVPNYGSDEVDVLSSKVVAQYEPTVRKEINRRQKKLLEELAPHIAAPQGRPIAIDVLLGALARAELRIAYLLTGDLLATIDELRGMDPQFLQATEAPGRSALAAVLSHPFAGDVTRFALTPEATALRRRIGSTWTG
jgi:tetratricopeptide (TPR) repeat protein